jgi:hypothetical protein
MDEIELLKKMAFRPKSSKGTPLAKAGVRTEPEHMTNTQGFCSDDNDGFGQENGFAKVPEN